jgi:hypothetical protein
MYSPQSLLFVVKQRAEVSITWIYTFVCPESCKIIPKVEIVGMVLLNHLMKRLHLHKGCGDCAGLEVSSRLYHFLNTE